MPTLKMLRLKPLLRHSLLTQQRRTSTSTPRKPSDPLRILFCGSDEFSATSLTALVQEHTSNPSLIHSIDVVVRSAKRTGRGLKVLQEVPLQSVARSLSLPIHVLDTFTGWTPPADDPGYYNLVVAVSFGLFVPRRILRGARYGGLNVHPSLLPDLRGPAPLHRALLAGRSHTGVSLQTLSEEGFDKGEVLAQTPLPGLPIGPGMELPLLRDMLAAMGAEMLVEGLRAGLHVPPRRDVGWVPTEGERKGILHAPKITKADAEVQWDEWTSEVVARRARVLGDVLWSRAVARDGKTKRVIFRDVQEVKRGKDEMIAMQDQGLVRLIAWRRSDGEPDTGEQETGPRWTLVPYFEDVELEGCVVIPFAGGDCVRIRGVQLEGAQNIVSARTGFKRLSYTLEEVRDFKRNPNIWPQGFSDFLQSMSSRTDLLGLLAGPVD